MSSELEIKERLIDYYEWLIMLREIAAEEGSVKTIKAIDKKIGFIKLKLQPLELPDDPTKKD